MKKDEKMRYNEDDERTLLEDILDFVKVFAICAIIILLFVNFIAHPVTVIGHSMDPTLANGEYGFTGIINQFFKPVSRGDIVVLKMKDANGNTSHWVKRVIGLPGETVEARDGVVYINGEPLDESGYLSQTYIDTILKNLENEIGTSYGPFTSDFGPVTLTEDQYYVLGDNRPYSKDSRHPDVGPVSKDDIFGTNILVLFPFNKAGLK